MPVLDTVVLFAALSAADPRHEKAVYYMSKLHEEQYFISAVALLEFDLVLKSRGFSYDQCMEIFALLAADYPYAKVTQLSPTTLFLAAHIEDRYGLDYFDACVAAEALLLDRIIVSTDPAFDEIEGLKRIW